MFDRIKSILKKKEQVEEPKKEIKEIKKANIEIEDYGLFIKVDIKESCNVSEYVEFIKDLDKEYLEDKIPNSILFDNSININKKVIYLFEKDNKSYSIFETKDLIKIDERVKLDNNQIEERIIKIYKNDDNYCITKMKHNEVKSTYYSEWFEKNNPDFEWFQLGKENAINLSKEVLNNLEKIPFLHRILNINDVYNYLNIERVQEKQRIEKIDLSNNDTNNKVKEKK